MCCHLTSPSVSHKHSEVLLLRLIPVKEWSSDIKMVLPFDKVIETFWILACLTGMVLQNAYVTRDYFEYMTSSEVTFQTENEFSPPAFSLCFHLVDLRIQEKFTGDGTSCYQNLTHRSLPDYFKCREKMLHEGTIDELLNNKTFNITSMIDDIRMTMPDGERVHLKNSSSFFSNYAQEYYRNGLKCLKISFDPQQKLSNDILSQLSTLDLGFGRIRGSLSWSDLLVSRRVPMLHLFHDSRSHSRGIWQHVLTDIYDPDLDSKLISYKKHVTYYLPPPFAFMCRNYTLDGLESKEHCIQSCLADEIKRKIHPDASAVQLTLTPEELKNKRLFFSPFFRRTDTRANITDFMPRCTDRCPLDCVTETYESDIITKFIAEQVSFMIILQNRNPTTRVIFSPKTSFLQYCIYIASVCGMWFGLSVHQILSLLLRSFKNLSIREPSPNSLRVNVKIRAVPPTLFPVPHSSRPGTLPIRVPNSIGLPERRMAITGVKFPLETRHR